MNVKGFEINVSLDYAHKKDGEVLLDIEETGRDGEQWIIAPLTRAEAMDLGGLLIGFASLMPSVVATRACTDCGAVCGEDHAGACNTALAILEQR